MLLQEPRPPFSLAHFARRVEARAGVAAALLVCAVLIGGGLMAALPDRHQPSNRFTDWVGPTAIAAMLAAMLVEAVFLGRVIDALRGGHLVPFAPRFALSRRRWPRIARPVLAAWWLAHFVVGIMVAFNIELHLAAADVYRHALGPYGWAWQLVAFVGIGFTLAFAFNLYAVLAMTAVGLGERAVMAVWRWRVTIDLAIAVAAAVVARHVRH